MKPITFITGNQQKADYLSRYIGVPIKHQKMDLEEIQSLDLEEIVTHKALAAYKKIDEAVIVEDVSLEFEALGQLPGPFIKFFQAEIGIQGLCDIIHNKKRGAKARCMYGYYDGECMKTFVGVLPGSISNTPRGDRGYGWDQIFIPHYTSKTLAEFSEEEYDVFYNLVKPIDQLRGFLLSLDQTIKQ